MLSFLLTLKRMLRACLRAWKDKEFQVLFVLTILTLISGTIFIVQLKNYVLLTLYILVWSR